MLFPINSAHLYEIVCAVGFFVYSKSQTLHDDGNLPNNNGIVNFPFPHARPLGVALDPPVKGKEQLLMDKNANDKKARVALGESRKFFHTGLYHVRQRSRETYVHSTEFGHSRWERVVVPYDLVEYALVAALCRPPLKLNRHHSGLMKLMGKYCNCSISRVSSLAIHPRQGRSWTDARSVGQSIGSDDSL